MKKHRIAGGGVALVPRPSMHADLLLEVPPAYGASIGGWLRSAAVVAEVGAAGVIIRAGANRVFRLTDLVTLVGEWMQAHTIDVVFAICDGTLYSIDPLEPGRQKPAAVTKELG